MVYKWYFSCQLGDYMLPIPPIKGNQETAMEKRLMQSLSRHKTSSDILRSSICTLTDFKVMFGSDFFIPVGNTSAFFVHQPFGCFQKDSGFSLQIIHFNKVFYYKSSISGHPYFFSPPFGEDVFFLVNFSQPPNK